MARGLTEWNRHVTAGRRAHPGMSLREALKQASHTWRSSKGADEIRSNPTSQSELIKWVLILGGGYVFLTMVLPRLQTPPPPAGQMQTTAIRR